MTQKMTQKMKQKMKILVLNGSPKKRSDTFRLTDAFLKGLKKANDINSDINCEINSDINSDINCDINSEIDSDINCGINSEISNDVNLDVNLINVIEKKISPCMGCFGCWKKNDGHCVIDDDQNEILDLYRDADLIIWSLPLYCYGMPSHLKAVLDRTIPLVRMKMVQLPDGTVRHEPLVDFSKIRTLVICGCGFPNWEGNFDSLKMMCRTCFRNPEIVCVPETPLMNVPEAAIVADPLLERFEKAGEEYAANLTLSEKTIAELEEPMIPSEEYIRNVNKNEG